ncbi:hypothetical protein CEE44_01905 [Candidatus Woesearchaeota archaeon B3_Woes]|nr:MAG: hypothetical protein CEE44_01905 [Candidatus Woesearchaeota archaeon B3_Woes]
MDWQAFHQEIKELSDRIDYHPDTIIGITRGGIVPARILSSSLEIKSMYCLTVRKERGERRVVTEVLDNLVGKNILLVEDMLETGRSLIIAKEYLESKGAIVKTACLYVMSCSEIEPNYYLRQVQNTKKFPWE